MQVLVIGYVWPEPDSSAAGSRMIQILEYFLSTGYTVSFATTASPSHWTSNLDAMGILTSQIELNNSNFDFYLKGLNPDLVIFDRFMIEEQFGWRVTKTCPDAIKILDTEDLHFLRNFREREYQGKTGNEGPGATEIAKREIASIYRCDLSLIISEAEMKLLTEDFNISPGLLFYLPFLFEEITSTHINALPGFENRKNFISIGNFRHAPNVDAIINLKEHIWPLIHNELPNAKMEIYGAYPSARIEQLNDFKRNFIIKGRAKDASEVVKKARVSLAPIRYGAGLKGKLAEAMIYGTPSVTTTTGAEGMNGELPWNGYIANDPTEFAKAAVSLYTSPSLWQQSCNKGFEIINSRFSKNGFYEKLNMRLIDLKLGIARHRELNFIGAMLVHHRVRSTYFLSKYIENKTELEKLKNLKK